MAEQAEPTYEEVQAELTRKADRTIRELETVPGKVYARDDYEGVMGQERVAVRTLANEFVCVNGVHFYINKRQWARVPMVVAEVLQQKEEATTEMEDRMVLLSAQLTKPLSEAKRY